MKVSACCFSQLSFSCKNFSRMINPWKSKNEFIQHIYENIIYNKDGLIAINKSYGVPVYKIKENKLFQAMNMPFTGSSTFSIEESLPLLKDLLQVEKLYLVKSTERYSSGILLLCSNEKVMENVRKAFRRAKAKNEPYLIYWALIKGCPNHTEFMREKVGIKLSEINGIKQPVILKEFSTSQIKKQVIKPVIVEYSLIRSNDELHCSLVKIAVTSVKWHFLQLYMTTKASYILGDVFFSGCISNIMGKSVEINTTNKLKSLPKNICEKLLLPSASTNASIPMMVHLNSVILKGYDHGKDLFITANPLPHFLWICEKLDVFP